MREEEEDPSETSEAEDSEVLSEDELEAVSGGIYGLTGLIVDHSGTSGTVGGG
jgi:bacteriocin-like protein